MNNHFFSLTNKLPIWIFNLTLMLWLSLPASGFDLPPRPPDDPVQPVEPADPLTPVQTESVSGSKLVFQAESSTFDADDWTMIEWQTAAGDWVPVEGWQGTFMQTNNQLQVEWWIGSSQLNTGPYRWVVYPNQQSDTAEYVSNSFHLPNTSGQALIISE